MKFRTEIEIEPVSARIGYDDRIFAAGSCFADAMLRELRARKFRATGNFGGPLFNPASIAAAIRRASAPAASCCEELRQGPDGGWFHYGTNTLADGADREAVAARVDEEFRRTREALAESTFVLVTFGTAWVYRLRETGRIVANCHKQPQALFARERLSVEGIVAEWSELLRGPLASKRVILSVSPVRHLADGLAGNAASKAVLRLAADELAARFDHALYFPAFEILTDDLRDYRFYADDLVHPSPQAVAYVWEKFAATALTDKARALLPEVERIVGACNHRPLQPDSGAYKTFCRTTLEAAEELQRRAGIDFSDEIDRLKRILCG